MDRALTDIEGFKFMIELVACEVIFDPVGLGGVADAAMWGDRLFFVGEFKVLGGHIAAVGYVDVERL